MEPDCTLTACITKRKQKLSGSEKYLMETVFANNSYDFELFFLYMYIKTLPRSFEG